MIKEPIQAIQYTADNLNDVMKFIGTRFCSWNANDEELFIGLEGNTKIPRGAYIVKDTRGQLYLYSEEFFKETYTQVK